MALGLPVVTSDVAGAKELVADGVTGFVRPQRDAAALAAAVTNLVVDTDLRARMGAAGRRRVESNFSFTGRLTRVEDLYERVVEARQARRPDSGRRAVLEGLE